MFCIIKETGIKTVIRYIAGGVIGALLALVGVSQGLRLPEFIPQVKPVVIVKKVPVVVRPKKSKPKLYRISVLDKNGKVLKIYAGVTGFEFLVIGATLTNKSGKTFDVNGNIAVDVVK